MSDAPPPDHALPVAPGSTTTLTPNRIEQALNDFRDWLRTATDPSGAGLPGTGYSESTTIDLDTLLRLFVGLRQEINLQTKAVRSVLDQNATFVEQLRGLDPQAESREALRPVLKSLLGVYDVLALARQRMEKSRDDILPALEELTQSPALPAMPPSAPGPASVPRSPRGLWSGLFTRHDPAPQPPVDPTQPWREWAAIVQQTLAVQTARQEQGVAYLKQSIGALITGYQMGLARLEKLLAECGLEPMDVVGQSFDPEEMETVEIVTDGSVAANEVVAEVRRGYRWDGKVFRYAQVKVAKGG